MADQPVEGTDVQQNTKFNVNWLNVNVPTILAVIGVGVTLIYKGADMENRLAQVEQFRVSRTEAADKKFDDIQHALAPLVNLPYRVGVLEQQQVATGMRIDRLTEIVSGTMEMIRKDIGLLSTKVEVLSSKIDGLTPAKRASASP